MPENVTPPSPLQTPEQAERLRAKLAASRPPGARTLTLDELIGAGAGLWDDDEEFERFLKFLREIRGHKA